MKKTVLITGATGYLGSHLLKALVRTNYKIILLVRVSSNLISIKDYIKDIEAIYKIEEDGISQAFQTHQIDCVLHCATNYGRKQNDPLQTVQANLILPLTILHTGKKYGLKYFLNTDTLLDKRINDYSLSKKHFNDWLQQASHDVVAVNIALEHFYGPADDKSKFVSWIIDSVLNNAPTIPLTAGAQKRDFIYITDVVKALMAILTWSEDQSNGYYPFEVGTGVNTSIKDLVTLIAKIANYDLAKLNFGALPLRQNEVMESKVNLANLSQLNWASEVTLKDGLTKVINDEKNIRGLL